MTVDPIDLTDKKVLVLGATGTVAGPVVAGLSAAGNEVWAAARFRRPTDRQGLEDAGVNTVVLDLANPDFAAVPHDFNYVINLAVAHPRDFGKALAANAENLGLLMGHCQRSEAFLHCSSTGVYQPNGDHPFAESDPLGDNHRAFLPTYSISKIAAEVVARLACRQYNLPTVIARLNVPYGDCGGWPAMHLECLVAGAPITVLPGGPTCYNPIHSDDINRHIPRLLAAATVPATTVNWAGPDTVTVQEWCRYLGELTDTVPHFEETAAALPSVAVDTTRMDELIGPAEVSWRDGMRRMIDRFHPELLSQT